MRYTAVILLILVMMFKASDASEYKGLIDSLYQDNAYSIPEEERALISDTGGSATYGEITYESVQKLLEKLHPTNKDIFMDLGSGFGRMVIQVYLQSKVKESIGVELSRARHNAAVQAKEKLFKVGYKKHGRAIEFWNQNILDAPIDKATIVFLDGCMFQSKFKNQIIDKLVKADHPIRIVSVVALDERPDLEEVERLNLPTSWNAVGAETVLYKTKK